MTTNKAYGDSGVRDVDLQLNDVEINVYLFFDFLVNGIFFLNKTKKILGQNWRDSLYSVSYRKNDEFYKTG